MNKKKKSGSIVGILGGVVCLVWATIILVNYLTHNLGSSFTTLRIFLWAYNLFGIVGGALLQMAAGVLIIILFWPRKAKETQNSYGPVPGQVPYNAVPGQAPYGAAPLQGNYIAPQQTAANPQQGQVPYTAVPGQAPYGVDPGQTAGAVPPQNDSVSPQPPMV